MPDDLPADPPGDLPLLGFGLPVAGPWAAPEVMLHVARRAERLGYASLWTFQRLLYPAQDAAYVAQGALGPSHRSVLDPVVALALVAGATSRIGLGTATVCAPFTPPAVLAKAMTSLDVVSGGRLSVGVGMGWMSQEYEAAGVPFDRRGARFEEYLRCLVALWTQDPVEFAGEFYRVPRSHVGPPPVQRPHPPVLVGGTAPVALRRAGRLAQGWIGSSRQDLATLADCVRTVRDGAREAGRDPDAVRIVLRGVVELVTDGPGRPGRAGPPDPAPTSGGPCKPLHGSREQVLDDLAALRAHGVTEVFLDLNLSPRTAAPGAGAADMLAYAEQVLDAFAPGDLRRAGA